MSLNNIPLRHWLGALLMAFVWSTSLVAGDSRDAHDDTVLWRVERADSHAGYLFGTMHTDDPRVMKMPGKARRAFEGSGRLAVEMQLTPATMSQTMALMMRSDDSSLSDAITADRYGRVVKALAGRGIGESTVNRMKIWAVVMTLIAPQNRSGVFLDLKLQQEAAEREMPVHSLESPAEQLGGFDRLELAEQGRLLAMALDLVPDLEAMHAAVTEAYLEEDLARILQLSRQTYTPADQALYDKLMRLLVDKRNQVMVEHMKPLLKQGDVFVAIGALHLPGGEGVVNLLKKQGYNVEPVR